jgi:hypothetical protein
VPVRALLDASVLVPAALRDTLLLAAEADLYQPFWSEPILAEVERALAHELGVPAADAADLTATLREAFPEAIVTGFEALIPAMTVVEHDRHVAAAAVLGHAHALITLNTRHFPPASLAVYQVDVQSPDEFLTHLFTLDPEALLEIIHRQAADLRDPPLSPRQVCDALQRTAPGFVALVRPLLPS